MANKNKSKALVKEAPKAPLIKSRHRAYNFVGQDGRKYHLTYQEKKFAELFLELQGDGKNAIVEAGYNVNNSRGEINWNLAKSMASEYLMKPNISAYVTNLLTRYGFDSESVEKQHLFLINQFGDLSAKSKGIDMYYKRFGLYPKDQAIIDALTKYKNLSDEELSTIVEGEIIPDSNKNE